MAGFYVTGPTSVFCSTAGGSPEFLGHSRKGPEPTFTRRYKPFYTDLSGEMMPHGRTFAGKWCDVVLELERFDMGALQRLEDEVTAGIGGGVAPTPGLIEPGELGSIMDLEGGTVQLWLRFDRAGAALNAAPGKAPGVGGLHFFAAALDGQEAYRFGVLDPLGVRLNFFCQCVFDPTVTNAFGFGAWKLYDYSMAGLPAGA